MKLDKEKILSKVGNISGEAKKITLDITNKTKDKVIDTKEKITTKLEDINPKQLITEEDILKILDGIYDNVLNGLGKASPPVEEFAKDYLSKEKVISRDISLEEKTRKLIMKSNNRGGTDNISVAYLIREKEGEV